MSGETDLNKLIATIRPGLRGGTYVFVTVAGRRQSPWARCRYVVPRERDTTLSLNPHHHKCETLRTLPMGCYGTSARPIPTGCGGTYPQTWGICLWRSEMSRSFVAASFQPDRCRVLSRRSESVRARSWTIPAACDEHATR